MKFAKPYENHKVAAVDGGAGSGELEWTEDRGGAKSESSGNSTHRYYYTMIGQFWTQDLPQYCIYMTQKQVWKRYVNTSLGFKWDPYKCVIMATPEVESKTDVFATKMEGDNAATADAAVEESLAPNATAQTVTIDKNKQMSTPQDYASSFSRWGGGFRYVPYCYFPMNYRGTSDWIPAPMTLWFFGRDDSNFGQNYHKVKNSSSSGTGSSGTRYIISLDGDDEIIDYGENPTALKTIDLQTGETLQGGIQKVYSLKGQYMGTTTDGLSKGVYIVGGRKVVVE